MADNNRFGSMFDDLKGGDESAETKTDELAMAKKPDRQQKTKKPLPKYKDPNYVQVGLYIPKDLHQKLKIGSALKEIEISDIAADALWQWVKNNVSDI